MAKNLLKMCVGRDWQSSAAVVEVSRFFKILVVWETGRQ
jgi:hypothetical protein